MKNSDSHTLICGLEIHVELKTRSKMFCSCANDPFGAVEPNIHTCPVCLGMPGGLPVANKAAIEWTIKAGLALGCEINLFSKFDRKNYFYPDLPKSYQISQYDIPFCHSGVVETSYGPVRITRIHLEEDTAKLMHTTVDGEKLSLIDFNRSSVPLMEIVSEPDIHHPEQAKEYAKKIRDLLRFIGAADCDMEQGGMRLEANISLQKTGETELPPYKVEVKNINSFKFAQTAIEYEMQRQAEILAEGKTPPQETRGFDASTNTTFAQRSKEDAQDYRYFPDPDLPPVRFSREKIEELRAELPELPEAKAQRLETTYGVAKKSSMLLLASSEKADFLESLCSAARSAKLEPTAVLAAVINKKLATVSLSSDFSREKQSELVKKAIQEYQQATQSDSVTDAELTAAIKLVLKDNPDAVAKYHNGETKVIGFFMGQVLRTLGKKVDSQQISATLIQALKQ